MTQYEHEDMGERENNQENYNWKNKIMSCRKIRLRTGVYDIYIYKQCIFLVSGHVSSVCNLLSCCAAQQ